MASSFYSRSSNFSTFRFVIFCLGLATASQADSPQFKGGGFQFSLSYGIGLFALDSGRLASQVGAQEAQLFTEGALNAQTLNASLYYTILGHASVGTNLTATGWNLTDDSRGGMGILVGTVGWHPIQLAFLNKENRPFPIDASLHFGLGYGIVGQKRGMDGLVFQTSLLVDYYLFKYVALGAVLRGNFFAFNSFYVNYQDRALAGNTLKLDNGSGGAFWNLGITLTLRAGP
jgi:hypothetical protein